MDDNENKQAADNAFLDSVGDSQFHLIHPAKVEYIDLYPSEKSAEIQVAQTQVSTGRMVIAANNLKLGGSANFLLTASSLLGGYVLNMSLKIEDNHSVPNAWGFMAIRELQVSFSPSQVQNLTISGQSLYDYSLLSCPTKSERNALLKAAGSFATGESTVGSIVNASIPLSFILANNSVMNGFPLDLATMSTMTITVVFNSAAYFVQDANDGTTWSNNPMPTSFESCSISCTTVDVQNQDFAMRTHLQRDPNAVYTIPVKYLSSEQISVQSYNTGTQVSRQIQGFQDGITTDLIYTFKPLSWISSSDGSYKYPNSVDFSKFSLEYAGQVLNKYDTNKEYQAQCIQKWGDSLNFDYSYSVSGNTAIASGQNVGVQFYDNGQLSRFSEPRVYDSSFAYRPRRVISGNRTENLVSYSGKSLNLKFTTETAAVIGLDRMLPNLEITAIDTTTIIPVLQSYHSLGVESPFPTGEDYEMNLTYINEGVLEISPNGLVKLITS